MFKIQTQLKVINYCFGALIFLILLLIFSGMFGVKTLTQRQKWVDETNYVMNLTEIAERDFSKADFAGRTFLLTGSNNENLPALRQAAFESLAEVKKSIVDNPAQKENIESLEVAVRESFKTQDEQLQSVVKNGDSITYKIETTQRRTALIESVETLFTRIKINQLNVLRIDRMPRLALWQWRLVYFTGIVLGLLLAVSSALFILLIRLLRRNIEAIHYMEIALDNTESGRTSVPTKELEKLYLFLQNDVTTLESIN